MKRLLFALGLVLGLCASAQAQQNTVCIGVGGINNVPVPGVFCQSDYTTPTYAATSVGLVPGTAPTDIACLTGSATKTVRLKRILVSGTAGTAINVNVFITKHASANTGGTLATSTALPVPYTLDTTFPAVSATTSAWTANPTIADSTPGIIGSGTVFLPVTSTASAAGAMTYYFDDGGPAMAPPVLRGVAQQVCVNLNGATAPSTGAMNVTFIWSEQNQ